MTTPATNALDTNVEFNILLTRMQNNEIITLGDLKCVKDSTVMRDLIMFNPELSACLVKYRLANNTVQCCKCQVFCLRQFTFDIKIPFGNEDIFYECVTCRNKTESVQLETCYLCYSRASENNMQANWISGDLMFKCKNQDDCDEALSLYYGGYYG